MDTPSERKLKDAERDLKTLRRGAQRAVGGGIYMRLDGSGRRRFQFRIRTGDGHPSGTYDSWQEGYDARSERESASSAETAEADVAGPSAAQLREWTIARYASEAWWPTVVLDCDATTQVDYRRGLDDLLPHVRKVTLGQLESAPLLIDEIREKVARAKKERKTDRRGRPNKRVGELPRAAADKPIKILSAICTHAAKREVLRRNPVHGVKRFNRRRSSSDGRDAPSHRRILPSEVKRPHTVARAGAGMRGNALLLEQRRLIPELIAAGMRPSDTCAMRHNWWRDEHGRRPLIRVDAAVKDLEGHLIEGEPKTGERDLYLFDAIAERLERIYELQGCPGLDALTLPNRDGGLLDWGNWRSLVWYPSLHRAGIAAQPTPVAEGAFYPYVLRHVGVTVMLHAERPGRGTYSEREVARQFGHTVQTLDRVYADIPKDFQGIGGLTMDEIIRAARRDVWGPMPGDADYDEVEYDLVRAESVTGISAKALAARIQRGSLPGVKRRGKYYVAHFDLMWHGLAPLRDRRGSEAAGPTRRFAR
jgi:hypothetical protein